MKKVFVSLGIIGVIILIICLCFSLSSESAAIGIIGGADGPTAVLVTGNWLLPLLIILAISILAIIIAIRIIKKKK